MSNDVSVGQDVLITRIFDAPREQVFKAWIDPDEVAVWYGPAHMDVPRDSVRIDARVGGRSSPRGGGPRAGGPPANSQPTAHLRTTGEAAATRRTPLIRRDPTSAYV